MKKLLLFAILAIIFLSCKKEEEEEFTFTFSELTGIIVYEEWFEIPDTDPVERAPRIMICPANKPAGKKALKWGEKLTISNSGEKIAFYASGLNTGFYGWYTMNLNDQSMHQVVNPNAHPWAHHATNPAWSPDDKKLSIGVEEIRSSTSIVDYILTFDIASGNLLDSIALPTLYEVTSLEWSSDGSRLFFSAKASSSPYETVSNIWSVKPGGADLRNVSKNTPFEDQSWAFDFSPDQNMIVISDRGWAHIANFTNGNIEDTGIKFMSEYNDNAHDYCPRWSSDAKYLVYPDGGEIRVTDAQARKSLFFNEGNNPDWR